MLNTIIIICLDCCLTCSLKNPSYIQTTKRPIMHPSIIGYMDTSSLKSLCYSF
ncbi:hypothetical protein ACB098_06G009200 [Castanea mollissima]